MYSMADCQASSDGFHNTCKTCAGRTSTLNDPMHWSEDEGMQHMFTNQSHHILRWWNILYVLYNIRVKWVNVWKLYYTIRQITLNLFRWCVEQLSSAVNSSKWTTGQHHYMIGNVGEQVSNDKLGIIQYNRFAILSRLLPPKHRVVGHILRRRHWPADGQTLQSWVD